MTGTGNNEHFRTATGSRSAWWRVDDHGRIEITHLADRESAIDTARFAHHAAMPYSRDGVMFTVTPTLAQAHSLLPEYHALWCAVSEEFRRRFAS
ncbi:hypothetical protein C5E45_27535 [Nocardia nova]|uniref:Uncharacterized protein n=1 Tax=Nocardia nova TaxID=37330 RepID=A0A2S6AIE6_9NOCA|nr:hypothetical protein [Nocardia nova]PPJ23683.1 hypothetical protein C5E41_23760 [Nocardia nova]PPJ35002.1 hypothetical protein C5E45_27535 [Nocardia nova]